MTDIKTRRGKELANALEAAAWAYLKWWRRSQKDHGQEFVWLKGSSHVFVAVSINPGINNFIKKAQPIYPDDWLMVMDRRR